MSHVGPSKRGIKKEAKDLVEAKKKESTSLPSRGFVDVRKASTSQKKNQKKKITEGSKKKSIMKA